MIQSVSKKTPLSSIKEKVLGNSKKKDGVVLSLNSQEMRFNMLLKKSCRALKIPHKQFVNNT